MDERALPERLERKAIYESDYVCLYTDRVRLSDGSVIEKYHQIHYSHEAVSIVVFNEKEEVLLIWSKRYTVMRLEWEIPAGRMEAGESREEAARRECREETGFLPGIRRIHAKERKGYRDMEEMIKQILPLWGMEAAHFSQIYPSAWEVSSPAAGKGSFVLKQYSDRKLLERNIKVSSVLLDCGIPAAEAVPAKTGEAYVRCRNRYFIMTKKLPGSNLTDIKDTKLAREMGRAMARLHVAFQKCEKELSLCDNSLLKEMKGWVRENLMKNGWKPVSEAEYLKAVEQLESVYDALPEQLIHRDVHYGNFLFHEGRFSGYIDFDLSQKNIRIFDLCYFLAGLLAEKPLEAFTREEWLESVKAVLAGYESIIKLSEQEKRAFCCVAECIEILFAAYFTGNKDIKLAEEAYQILGVIRDCEEELAKILWEGRISESV